MTTQTDPSTHPETSDLPSDEPAQRGDARARRVRGLTVLASGIAAVVLVVGTVGPPLLGRGVFLATDLLYKVPPWNAEADAVGANPTPHGPVSDTLDATYPDRVTSGESLRHGDVAGWKPEVAGGQPLAAVNEGGVWSILALPFSLLPSWYAPAAVKALGMLTAIGFTYLFCRRLGTRRIPGLLAGIAFAGSGFMVMWTNWFHVDTAAFVPAVFWATERFLQRRTPSSVVPVAIATAAMLLGGFPAVAGYALLLLAPYVAVRVLAERPTRAHGRPGSTVQRRVLLGLGGIAGGVLAGVLLVAWFLLPFSARLSGSDLEYRAQGPDDYLGVPALLTAVAPEAFGLSSDEAGAYLGSGPNQVEAISFVGVVTALLAVLALALPMGRRVPRHAVWALAATALLLGAATYGGGPILAALQELPLFSDNRIGRIRSVLGFAVAVLAAVGLDALLDRSESLTRRQRRQFTAVLGGVGVLVVLVAWRSSSWARDRDATDVLRDGLVVPGLVAAAAVAAVTTIWFFRGSPTALARSTATALLPILLVFEALVLAVPLLPNESRDTLYPDRPATEFLRERLGDDRVALEGLGYYANGVMLTDLRSLTGHAFYAPTWKDMLLAADPAVFQSSETLATLHASPEVLSSPLLDRMGATWFATAPATPVPGRREPTGLATATCDVDAGAQELRAGDDATTVTVPAAEGLRGLVVQVCEPATLAPDAALVVDARRGADTVTGRLALGPQPAVAELSLAVPAEDLAGEGTMEIGIRLEGGGDGTLVLAGPTGGTSPSRAPAVDLIRPTDDGLRLAYADELRIYERQRALPRIHWAGRAEIVADDDERIDRLADPDLPPDTVILGNEPTDRTPATRATATEADVELVADTAERIEVSVDADGSGYLVVADALQDDWAVSVDGEPAELVDADHAGVAVAVPEGRHEVELHYAPRRQRLGVATSLLTALGLAGVAGTTWWRRRRGPG